MHKIWLWIKNYFWPSRRYAEWNQQLEIMILQAVEDLGGSASTVQIRRSLTQALGYDASIVDVHLAVNRLVAGGYIREWSYPGTEDRGYYRARWVGLKVKSEDLLPGTK